MSVEVHTVIVYSDQAGNWRWHGKDSNHEVVAESGEGYISKDYCLDAAKSLFPNIDVKVKESEA